MQYSHLFTWLLRRWTKPPQSSVTEEQNLPEVELDITLADLYARERAPGKDERIALVLSFTSSEVAPTSAVARNTKFLYQENTFNTTPEDASTKRRKEIQHTMAIKYLSLTPRRDAFAAGNMPVILFDLENSEESATARSRQEVENIRSTLKAQQRPEILFFPGPSQIATKANRIELLAVKAAIDEIEGSPVTLDLETHYFLNSKAALSTSGLPSPKSVLLELDGFSTDARSCCITCRQADDNRSIPKSCTGARGEWLKSRIAHTMSQISSQQLPFVLKCQQTFGGGGTWVVSTPSELSDLKATLSTLTLPKLYSRINSSNAHLKPATLILSEMIRDPIGDWGLSFFVSRAGECTFLAVTHQVIASRKAWIGSTITYIEQDRLKAKFTPIMQQIGAWLHSYGYYGPCGADILETAPADSDSYGRSMNIVDLNVRIPGSLLLGFMRGHFSERRGLHEASLFSLSVKMAREAFIVHFPDLLREGEIVIVSWYEDVDTGVSFGVLIIGARNRPELEKRIMMVKKFGSEIRI
ncbi:MAG: hypothetical protein Q9191_006431 [Dirinaria sp. TL-2023a]